MIYPEKNLSKFETYNLLSEVIENRDKLDNCVKHSFGELPAPMNFGQKLRCTICSGTMDAVQAFRYCQGFKAAGGNPSEIINGFE